MKLLIITEANEKIASGHLMESIALARRAMQEKQEVLLAVNDNICREWKYFLNGIPIVWYEYNLDMGMITIQNCLASKEIELVITDVRELKEYQVKKIRSNYNGKVVCLDEWGNRELLCDVIVNNMISSYFWKYGNSNAKLYCGPQYLMLKDALQIYHRKEKKNRENIEKVVISMGGVDPQNHTMAILQHLVKISYIQKIDVVLGGGYEYETELRELYGSDSRMQIHRNIDYLYDLFLEDDLAFSAGGNTLYEMASIGIPSIIVPTMEHEKVNGYAFQKKGYGILLDENNLEHMEKTVLSMTYEKRNQMSKIGKQLIDGMGTTRVWSIIKDTAKG